MVFLAANLSKVAHGGWLPLLIATSVFVVMTTWRRGREIVSVNRRAKEGSLADFVEEVRERKLAEGARRRRLPAPRQGHGAAGAAGEHRPQPGAARVGDHRDGGLRERPARPRRRAPDRRRPGTRRRRHPAPVDPARLLRPARPPRRAAAGLRRIGAGERRPRHQRRLVLRLPRCHPPQPRPGMRGWRKTLFIGLAHNAADPAAYFGLPGSQTVTMGSDVDV
nr:KUP/HAK/KT family potassium transporter [Angustibacter aerolatus]